MKEYVLCFVPICKIENFTPSHVLLIRKLKPEWQKGLFNLPGGKIEAEESPYEAAERELMEETGLIPTSMAEMGVLRGDDYTVYVIRCGVPYNAVPLQLEAELLVVEWIDVTLASQFLIPNLKIVIPLCLADVKDWTLREICPTFWGISFD